MEYREPIFQIAVCDDEAQELKTLRELTEGILRDEHIAYTIWCCESGERLREAVRSGKSFDLLILDVAMPERDGLDLARELREGSYEQSIIFVSYNREMALRGYEVSADRYLAKPVEREKLREALLHCRGQKRCGLPVPVDKGIQRIFPEEILYIETSGRGCRIVTRDGEKHTGMRISELERLLDKQSFIRCHQGFLVSFAQVRGIRTAALQLLDGTQIPVSKHRLKEVRERFLAYLAR